MPRTITLYRNDVAVIEWSGGSVTTSTHDAARGYANSGTLFCARSDRNYVTHTSNTGSGINADHVNDASLYGIPAVSAGSLQAQEAPPITERSLREAYNRARTVPIQGRDNIQWSYNVSPGASKTHTTQVYNVPNDPLDQCLFFVNMGFHYLFDMLRDFKGKIKFDTKIKQFVKIEEK